MKPDLDALAEERDRLFEAWWDSDSRRDKVFPDCKGVARIAFNAALTHHEAERDAAVAEAVERGDFALVWKPTVRELFRKGLLADGMTDVTWLVREGWYLPAADEQKG